MSDAGIQVTPLLERFSQGDRGALDELLPIVQRELHARARAYMRRERRAHTLQPTAFVNEAYVRLVERQQVPWKNRTQFFAIASRTMRQILVEHACARKALKRQGGKNRMTRS